MKIICLPGMGGNELVFEPQKEYFKDRLVLPILTEPVHAEESLQDYCKRWAEDLKKEAWAQDDFVLAGMSMGGFMAQELSKHLPAKAIVLIGSLQKPLTLAKEYAFIEKASRKFPYKILKWIRRLAPYMITHFEQLNKSQSKLIHRMAAKVRISFYRWQGFASAEWIQQGFQGQYPCPVFSVHGRKDNVLRVQEKDHNYDLIIEDARHMLNVTHSKQVNAFIEDAVAKVSIS